MAVAVKDAGEWCSLKTRLDGVRIWGYDSFVEYPAARQIRVQVDVSGQDEVLVVVFGGFAEGDQVGGCGDLVWVVGRAAAAGVFAGGGFPLPAAHASHHVVDR